MSGNKPRSQYKKKRRRFYGLRPQGKNRATDSDVVKENNMAAFLSNSFQYLSHLEKATVEPAVACSNLEGNKFIYSNVLNELICNTLCSQCKSNSLQLYQKDAARKGLQERLVA